MTYDTLAWIEFAIDTLGLVFCLTVLAYGVRHRKTLLPARCDDRVRIPGAFNLEMRLQTVQQQAEATLVALNTAMAGMPPHADPFRGQPVDTVDNRSRVESRAPEERPAPETLPSGRMPDSASPYETVRKLADQGLDVDAIYRRLRIPKGEIRLALHLREADGLRLRASA